MISFNLPSRFSLALSIVLAASQVLEADVKMPAIFGDHMVLQEGMKLPVWGTADPGEKVVVAIGTETGSAEADKDGKWKIELAPISESSSPLSLQVTGRNTLNFTDVVIGDVWVCSGQSNMVFQMKRSNNGQADIAQANDPGLRLFLVGRKISVQPLTDVGGHWQLCSPESVPDFSAVGYYFGREMRSTLKHPVGLIGTYWGGTSAAAWTSLSGLQKEPSLQHFVDDYNKALANYPAASVAYPAQFTAYQAELTKWNEEYGNTLEKQLKEWDVAVKAAQAAGQPLPPKPGASQKKPHQPTGPDGSANSPTVLFNAMLSPLIPYAIKGVLWYQGEQDANSPFEYHTLFTRMIADWRQRWGEENFPFIYVQLPRYKGYGPNPPQTWPYLREAQLQTLTTSNTAMASAIDIGDPNNIHPPDKLDVGLRLAQAAKHLAYGMHVVYSGPIYSSMKIEGSSVRVQFTQTGSGLIIGTAPWRPPGIPAITDANLVGFSLAGADQKWFPANARIDGMGVVVSCPEVPQPVAVRYGWANAPEVNLYNKEGLPASPFRSDDWVDSSILTVNPTDPPNTPGTP